MIKYSVIMPIYNAIEFIEKNLKKFEKLNRDDIELIIVNDGSTDASIDVVKKYEDKIKNLILINQENKGVSYSRNIGIKSASGKYVAFLDCDDSMEDNIFDKMDEIYSRNYDLVRYGVNIIEKKHSKKQRIVEQKVVYENFNKSNEIFKLVYTTNKFNTVWNQIIKKEVLEKNKICFDINHKYAEDFEFNKKILNYIDTICFLPDCLYNYYMNENSISRREVRDNVMKCIIDTIEIHSQTYIDCKEKCEDILEDSFKNISLELQTSIRRLYFIKNINFIELRNIFNQIRSYEDIKLLSQEAQLHNWKSNLFIDNCLYKEPNYVEIVFYKYYFKIKKLIKSILY